MSYNRATNAVLAALGITSGRLPVNGMASRIVNGVTVWIAALPPMPEGRRAKRSTHRLFCRCPRCGWIMSVGRIHQHLNTATCIDRAARNGNLYANAEGILSLQKAGR